MEQFKVSLKIYLITCAFYSADEFQMFCLQSCSFIESLTRKLELKSDISFKLIQLNAYTDDIDLVARTKKAVIKIFNNVREEAALVGHHINEDKTKYMHIQRTGSRNKILLQMNNYLFEKINILNTWDPY
jgi:hypothetical protein